MNNKGVMPQKQQGYFSIRFVGKVGKFNSEELRHISVIADLYGQGEVTLTNRATIEVPYIKLENEEKVFKYINDNKLVIDVGGETVRAVSSCKGSICKNGLIDVDNVALKIQQKLLAKSLPGKFKIVVVGCMNGYGRAQSNDIGIVPTREIKINQDKCILCGKCSNYCKDNALNIKENKMVLDKKLCLNCGSCVRMCPVDAIEKGDIKVNILLGGRLGRQASLAIPMKHKFSVDEVINAVENIVDYFNENANRKERFAKVIERIGFENVEDEILKRMYYLHPF